AGGRLERAEQHLDEGGLARPVLAEKRVDLPLLDGQVDVVASLELAEYLRQPTHLKQRHGAGFARFAHSASRFRFGRVLLFPKGMVGVALSQRKLLPFLKVHQVFQCKPTQSPAKERPAIAMAAQIRGPAPWCRSSCGLRDHDAPAPPRTAGSAG